MTTPKIQIITSSIHPKTGKAVQTEIVRDMNATEILQVKKEVAKAADKQLMQAKLDFRTKRNALLADSDWTELPSALVRLSAEERKKWEKYRQALRDMSKTITNWLEIKWPEVP